jgi:hypothetical protein
MGTRGARGGLVQVLRDGSRPRAIPAQRGLCACAAFAAAAEGRRAARDGAAWMLDVRERMRPGWGVVDGVVVVRGLRVAGAVVVESQRGATLVS